MSPLEIAAVFSVVTAAACIQGAIGFGMALIAAPLLVLIEPDPVPGPLISSSLVLVSLIALRDRAHVDFRTVRFSSGASPRRDLHPALRLGLSALAGAGVLARVILS